MFLFDLLTRCIPCMPFVLHVHTAISWLSGAFQLLSDLNHLRWWLHHPLLLWLTIAHTPHLLYMMQCPYTHVPAGGMTSAAHECWVWFISKAQQEFREGVGNISGRMWSENNLSSLQSLITEDVQLLFITLQWVWSCGYEQAIQYGDSKARIKTHNYYSVSFTKYLLPDTASLDPNYAKTFLD